MLDLRCYLRDMSDGHVHIFDLKGKIDDLYPCTNGVGFADFDMLNLPEPGEMYRLYRDNASLIGSQWRLLAASPYPDECIDIVNDFGLKGFGEIKLYDRYKKDDKIVAVPYKNMEDWGRVFRYANEHCMPVYLHYTLDTGTPNKLKGICDMHPNAKFVLCHLGLDSCVSPKHYDQCVKDAIQLAKECPNLYLDCSWTGAQYVFENPHIKLPISKVIYGTDRNPYGMRTFPENQKRHVNYFESIYQTTNFNTINSIFNDII